MGILDILQGNPTFTNDPGVTNQPNPALWGALNQPSPLQALIDQIKGQAPTPQDASAYGSMGVDPSATYQPAAPQSPFPQQQQQPPQAAPPPSGFGATAPFSFAGPGSMNVNPASIQPPQAPQPAPQPQPAPAVPPAVASAMASAPQASPIAVGSYQMPRIGSADDFEPDDEDVPANAKPAQGALPTGGTAPFSLAGPGIGDRLSAAASSIQHSSGLIPSLINGATALSSGQRTDPSSVAETANARWLLSKGASAQDVAAATATPAVMAAMITQYAGKDKYSLVKTADGMGVERPVGAFNQADGTIKKFDGSDVPSGSGGLGDMTKTGAAYLATVPPTQAKIIQGMVDGTVQPPSSFALAKPAWQAMLAGAKNLDPNFDENTWTARHKMSADIAASGNSSMGGILSNGKSSFKHLAEFTDSAAGLGNASHDYPGGGYVAYAQNGIGNSLGGSDTKAKIAAINDNLGHYGQESTKFYSGTGGGAEERMNALKEINPVTKSGEEMAAYADKEKSLMLDRLREKESQIRSVMGDAYLQQHPVFTPELQQDIARIDANVAKLKGGASAAPAASGAPPPIPSGWSVQVH